MKGLITLQPTGDIAGKKSEYKTKEEFVKTVIEEGYRDVDIADVGDGYMRYFPNGTEDSQMEFGKGEGVYMCVDKLTRGAFEIWMA
jgi:hypothetical protein